MTPSIFPFTLPATDVHYVSSPKLAERLWRRDRARVAQGLSYYGLDLEVAGAADVEIRVRSIHNGFSGGIGREVFRYRPELTEEDLADLRLIIIKRQTLYAEDEFHRREEARVAAQVEAIRREMFDTNPIPSQGTTP